MGDGSRWFKQAREEGTVLFGYHMVSHEDAVAGNVEGIRAALADRRSDGAITAGVTEVKSFYRIDANCLWITFAEGHLWWAFAEPEVEWLGEGNYNDGPSRRRMTIGQWQNTEIYGRPPRVNDLSSKLPITDRLSAAQTNATT